MMKRCLIGMSAVEELDVDANADPAGETSSSESRRRLVTRRLFLKDAHAGLASIYGVPPEASKKGALCGKT